MAQTWRMNGRPAPRPIDQARLRALGLRYVERFATTRGKLTRYLQRKLREGEWNEPMLPDEAIAALVGQFVVLGYVDDEQWAGARTRTMAARGLGQRRITSDLRAAGIAPPLVVAQELPPESRFDAANAFARRRRIGPFAREPLDEAGRRRALSAMLRAGHSFDLSQAFVESEQNVIPDRNDFI